jgi:hypothetical protein
VCEDSIFFISPLVSEITKKKYAKTSSLAKNKKDKKIPSFFKQKYYHSHVGTTTVFVFLFFSFLFFDQHERAKRTRRRKRRRTSNTTTTVSSASGIARDDDKAKDF